VSESAEIPARLSGDLRAGSLRREDLEAFGRLLEQRSRGTLLVTGAGDGPLALSTGLASASAARGARTALLECDLDRPALAAALGLEAKPGLCEYLRREAEAREILQPLVLAGPGSAGAAGPVVCIVAGEPDGDGSAFDSDSLRHALAKLRHAYDLLVVQGPPLGDRNGLLREAAAAADAAFACVGPSLAAGRAGRRLRKMLRRLGAPGDVVVYGN
jgi:Mrp family chromosome partitioning ATPase